MQSKGCIFYNHQDASNFNACIMLKNFTKGFTVYVLYNPSSGRTYTGFTSNLEQRILSHNSLATKGYTLKLRPWVIIHTELFQSKQEAMAREKQGSIPSRYTQIAVSK